MRGSTPTPLGYVLAWGGAVTAQVRRSLNASASSTASSSSSSSLDALSRAPRALVGGRMPQVVRPATLVRRAVGVRAAANPMA